MWTELSDPGLDLPDAIERVLDAARANFLEPDPQAADAVAFHAILGALHALLMEMERTDPANHALCFGIALHTLHRADQAKGDLPMRRVS